MGTTLHFSNDPVTLPLDNKGEFVDDLILLYFEFAREYRPIILRGSIGVFQDVVSKFVNLQTRIAKLRLMYAMPVDAGLTR